MFPDRLHRPVRPAVSLPPEVSERRGRLRPGPRVVGVDDATTGASDREREVGVLRERVVGDTADLCEDVAPKSADRARHRRCALQYLVHPAVEVEPGDVLDVLPPAEQTASVADLGVAGDGADAIVDERLHEAADGIRLEQRVPVDHDDHRGGGLCDANVQGGRLAAVLLPHDAHPRQGEILDGFRRAVVGAVVDDDDLQVRVVVRCERSDCGLNADRFVVRRHDHDDRWQIPVQSFLRATALRVPARERDDEHHARGDQHADASDHEGQEPDEPESEPHGPRERNASATLPGRRTRLDHRPGQSGKLRDRHEPEAARAQAWDQLPHRREGVAPVASAVVEHHDAARRPRRARVSDDRRDAPALPVLRVEVREHDQIPTCARLGERAFLRGRHRIARRRIGRPYEPGVPAGDPDDHRLGQLELEAPLPRGTVRERGVRERVVSELVAVADEVSDDLRMPRDLAADDEERGRHVPAVQKRCDLRCPAWVGAVVERQCDAPSRRRLAGDEVAVDGCEDRSAAGERRRAVGVVGLGARADRVRDDALEEDQRREDEQAEAEQPPVGRRAPQARAATCPQGFLPSTWLLPGVVGTVVVVTVVVLPGADPDRPGVVVTVVVVFV